MIKQKEVISIQSLRRLPVYLTYLEKLPDKEQFIAVPRIATDLGLTEVLIKKDLSYVTSKAGKPKLGHKIIDLINDINDFLGYTNCNKAALVGAGNLGKALLGYNHFSKNGISIVVAFDNDKEKIGQEINGIKIVDVSKLENLCRRMNIHVGIITTDEVHAQEVCDELVSAGIKAIWNFSSKHLSTSDDIIVLDENLASSLAILSKRLRDRK